MNDKVVVESTNQDMLVNNHKPQAKLPSDDVDDHRQNDSNDEIKPVFNDDEVV